MEVRISGKALANGAIDDPIQAVNLSSKQKPEGVTASTGETRYRLTYKNKQKVCKVLLCTAANLYWQVVI